MKHDTYHKKGRAELEQVVQDERQKLAQLRFDVADKKLKKTSDIQQARRRIARALTALQNLA